MLLMKSTAQRLHRRRHVLLLILACLFASIIAGVSCSKGDESSLSGGGVGGGGGELVLAVRASRPVTRPASRSLLFFQPEQEFELVVAVNGTVYLVESNSRKILWSFSSGGPIYSSHHVPINHENGKDKEAARSNSFVDCGDDWELYLDTHYGKLKLGCTIQDIVNKSPLIAEDGGIILGSRHATVLKVDPWSGRLIKNYGNPGSLNAPQADGQTMSKKGATELEFPRSMDMKNYNVELCIKRIDYSLLSLASNSDEQWNLTVAIFKAALQCEVGDNLTDRTTSGSVNEPGSDSDTHMSVPPACLLEFVVRHFRSERMFEAYLRLERTSEDENKDMLPVAISSEVSASPNAAMPSIDHPGNAPLSAQSQLPPLPIHLDFTRSNAVERIAARRSLESKNGKVGLIRKGSWTGLKKLTTGYIPWLVLLTVVLLIGYGIYSNAWSAGEKVAQRVYSKRRKSRRSGRSISSVEEGRSIGDDNRQWFNPSSLVDGKTDGRAIGKLFVTNTEIAKGSNGTVVFDGIYEGRTVAVKRLVLAHHHLALKEIQNLLASDQHPNIVRLYGVEYDKDFVYLSLERCTCSLNELIQLQTNSSHDVVFFAYQATSAMTEHKVRLNSLKATMQDFSLWRDNGYPSSLLLKLMRDMVFGLVHLHELGIIHRDIKPQNILITKDKILCAKLSDMGISKGLLAGMSSLGHHVTGHGSVGWQAPEQLLDGRQTRAVDMFSLGCVFFFCVSGGGHPFGDRFERDNNIMKNQMNLSLVEHLPEAVDLFSNLLHPVPQMRPKASEVSHHPFFWDSEMRLSFMRDASDRVESEDRDTNSTILKALESVGPSALGGKWDEKMEPAFINNIGRYRRYKYDSVRDLLRVIRNKLNHYRELPPEIQEILGPVPEGFDEYFTSRFPKLLIKVYKVFYCHCKEEKCFQKYFGVSI
ncbi:hypothetical protein Dimus_017440 [Dionaea muscipula]